MGAQSLAVEKMGGTDFLSSCQGTETESDAMENGTPVICRAYIQGFLDGLAQFSDLNQQEPSFEQRALQTRAQAQMLQDGGLLRSTYCIPDDTSIADIVDKINLETELKKSGQDSAEILSSVLRKHFPCAR